MSKPLKAKLGLDTSNFDQGIAHAMSEVGTFSTNSQKEMGKVSDKSMGVSEKTEASSQKQVQSWSRVNKAVGAVALISGGLFKSMVSASPGLSAAFAEMNFMFEEMFMVLGEQLAPIIEEYLVPVIEKLTDFIIGLDDKTQKWVAGGIGLVAMLTIASSTLGLFGLSLTVLLGPVGLIIIAIAALALAYHTNFLGIRDIIDGFISNTIGKFKDFADSHSEQFGRIMDLFQKFIDFVSPIAEVFIKLFVRRIELGIDIILLAFDFLLDYIEGVMTILEGIFNRDTDQIMKGFIIIFDGAIDFVMGIFDAFVDYLKDIFDILFGSFGGFGETLVGMLTGALATMLNPIIDAFNSAINGIIEGIEKIRQQKISIGTGKLKWSGKPFSGLPDLTAYKDPLPTLHRGGVIPGPIGQEQLIVGLGGEIVTNPMRGQSANTFDNRQSMQITNKFNFYNTQLPDRRSERRLIKDIDRQLRKSQNRYPSGRSG